MLWFRLIEMKLMHGILFGCLCVSSVFADEYNFDVSGDLMVLGNNTVIASGVRFEPINANVIETLQIDNYGVINTDFYVCDGCDLYVKNVGVFSGNVHLGANAKLIQVVNSVSDMNKIDGISDFSVLVENNVAIMLDDIVNFAGHADKIIFKDSVLKIDSAVGFDGHGIELRGEIDLIADDLSHFYGVPILTNITGDGAVHIVNNSPDVLYADVGYIKDGVLYVKRVRETDYIKIFKDDTGKFLNDLRDVNPGDALFDVLDNAPDMMSLRSEMNKSVRFNPEILVRPLNILHALDGLDFGTFEYGLDFGTFVVSSNDFNIYGVNVGLMGDVIDGLNVWGGLRVGVLEYDSDLDNFSGQIWGANIGARYMLENNLFVRANLVADVMNVDVGNVLYENTIYKNPQTISGAMTFDFGYVYNFQNSIYVEPFVGIYSDWWRTENISELNIDANVGLGAGYSYSMLGLRYDYSVRGIMTTDGDVGLSGRVGFWSEFDAIGGDVQISAVHMYDVMNYKIAFNARMWF